MNIEYNIKLHGPMKPFLFPFKTKAHTYIWSYFFNLDIGALFNDSGQHIKNNHWIYDRIPLDDYFEDAIKQGHC